MPKKDKKKKSDGKKDKASNNPDVNDIIHNVIRVLFILKKIYGLLIPNKDIYSFYFKPNNALFNQDIKI